MSKLVIVESPAKAKTIGKYLGSDYEVTASMGHIRDLPASQLGIDVEHGYTPQYISIKGKEKLIKELKSKAKHSDGVLLATDPDREGEAISWHLANILGLDPHEPNRVTFDEITKKGVQEGMAHPRAIDEDLFNAQQARRVLDRLVGYKLSPFLWRKVRRGLSAGRVQSVAVRLIDDREKEIEGFKPEEYWNVDATLGVGHKSFTARLASDDKGKKLLPHTEAEARAIEKGLEGAEYTVGELKKGKRAKQPTPAFITSTLQQEASRRLGFTATRTMRAAQTLYEGVDIAGHGTMGLITYMRTDSLRISDEAVNAAKEYIAGAYGEPYICPYKRTWKTKSATAAQDAHEAIRPSVPSLTPDEVDKSISGDTAKLYRMIWSRFMASQMADCQQDTVSVTVYAGGYRFKASGYTVTFDGFTALYEEATDEKEKKETSLPPLEQGQVLKLRELKSEQKFTQPPARYTEATLIKALEENGIGRPSTYAPIITHHRPRLCGARPEKAQADPAGPRRGRPDAGAVPPHRGCGLLRRDGKESRQGRERQGRLAQDCGRLLSGLCSQPRTGGKEHGRQEGQGAGRAVQRGLRPVRPPHGHQGGQVRQVPGLQRLPGVPGHKAAGQGYRRHLPQVRQGPHAGAQERQGPHLLRLRALPRLRFHDLGYPRPHQVRKVRLHPLPQGLQALLCQGGLRVRDAGAEEGVRPAQAASRPALPKGGLFQRVR